MSSSQAPRWATIERNTKETQIEMTFALDGMTSGQASGTPCPLQQPIRIGSDLPFLDHMMNTLACHGRFGLDLKATGDIEVDPHHLVEDCGIVLGKALASALNHQFSGIERAGCFAFPMDGTLAMVSMDLCGRPNLVWNVPLQGRPLGTLDGTLFKEFFKGWVDGSQATLHVHVPCADNDHHVIEAIFKAFARALRHATRPLGTGETLSTKGVLNAGI